MIRLPYKILGILLLTLGAFFYSANTASAQDVLEFIDLPGDDDVQGTLDVLLACRNGVTFELHGTDLLAHLDEGSRVWDISFAPDEETLLIEEHPLWLGESTVPLVHNDLTFPYSGFFTLLWGESLPAEPLTTCISGAGSGWCEAPLDIDDCHINTGLIARIAQIGPQDATDHFVDQLIFEVRAFDPEVGTNNGDGIERVEMSIVDRATGAEVYTTERVTAQSAAQPAETETNGENAAGETTTTPPAETEVVYCAFSDDCLPWEFSEHNYTWPSGAPVRNGYYLLRAIVSTPDDTHMALQTEIEVDVPPTFDTVHVPEGEFTMGADAENRSIESQDEEPAHAVTLDEFWIMETEVTNRQYARCVSAGACTIPADSEQWRDPAYADHPVVNVDWHQANDFAEWAGGRLPTEAEWEKACRGTDGRIFPWGDEPPTREIANYGNSSAGTEPVGSYSDGASPYGVLDMSGNVWEWTSSLDAPYPYQADDGREDSEAGGRRIMRGGSFYYTQYQLTCTFRLPVAPTSISSQNGFRLVFDEPFVSEGIAFASPADGESVTSPFEVSMVATGLTIEPAGEIRQGAGHFHILVDADFIEPGELVPFDDNHLHFGDGQTEATLELEPGLHTLRLQLANGAHIALEGEQYRDTITVNVAPE